MNWSAAARWSTLARAVCFLALLLFFASTALAQPGLLSSSDTAIGIDLDSTFVGPQNNGRYPTAEAPRMGIDGLATTKYLNFGGVGSGFIVTPTLLPGVPIDGFRITTANDAAGRDPATWSLFGFDGALTTTDSGPSPAINQTGLAEAWVPIASGSVALPGDPALPAAQQQRGVVGPMVSVNSTTPYQHYKFIVDSVKVPGNIMQFADIQFFADDTNPTTSGILAPTDPIIAVDGVPVPAGWKGCGTPNNDCSSSPGNEPPPNAIDQVFNTANPTNPTTKYLNFGEEKSGIIITNSEGPVDVNFMRLRAANDADERDPTSYQLYGTNDPITSVPNSNSNGTEVWTLISEGPLTLPPGTAGRHQWGDFVAVNSPANYTSYRLIFPTVRNATAANSMQIADIQFYTAIPEPSTVALVAVMVLALAAATRRRS
jgi:hypothetical protein